MTVEVSAPVDEFSDFDRKTQGHAFPGSVLSSVCASQRARFENALPQGESPTTRKTPGFVVSRRDAETQRKKKHCVFRSLRENLNPANTLFSATSRESAQFQYARATEFPATGETCSPFMPIRGSCCRTWSGPRFAPDRSRRERVS